MLATLIVVAGAPTGADDDEPLVTIKGGVRPDNRHFFDWTVRNRYTSPIVFIEFPQYRGDLFTPPAGWSQDWKNQSRIGGGKDAPGWVRTGVEESGQGIRPGGSAEFQLRVARAGALPRPGKVTVRFADGTEVIVANVELPSAKSFVERNVTVFGLAAIFVIALLIHFRRRAKRPSAPASLPPTASDEDRRPNR